jgi:replicative DNA helicase
MNLITQKPRPGSRGEYKKTLPKDIIEESPVDLKRMLPYDNEAEQGVLQACFSEPEAVDRAREHITPEDFYRRGYGIIFQRFVDFRDQQRGYTPTTVLESFKDHPEFERIETSILELGPFFTGQTSRHFAKIVKDFSVRRSLISAAIKMAEDSFSITPNIKQIESEFINTVRKLKRRCVP